MQDLLLQFFGTLAVIMLIAATIGLVGLLAMIRSIRAMRVPPHADFFTTLRYVPLGLVILIDLLDFGLDMLSAPIVWIVLDRMGLHALRDRAAIEGLLPFTGSIPVFTIAWVVTRMFNLGTPDIYYARPTSRMPPLDAEPHTAHPRRPRPPAYEYDEQEQHGGRSNYAPAPHRPQPKIIDME